MSLGHYHGISTSRERQNSPKCVGGRFDASSTRQEIGKRLKAPLDACFSACHPQAASNFFTGQSVMVCRNFCRKLSNNRLNRVRFGLNA